MTGTLCINDFLREHPELRLVADYDVVNGGFVAALRRRDDGAAEIDEAYGETLAEALTELEKHASRACIASGDRDEDEDVRQPKHRCAGLSREQIEKAREEH